jgi:plastocyanin
MDTKTKIQTVISLVLVALITALAYWAQVPSKDLKAQLIQDVDTVLVRIQDFAFDPDVVRIDTGTAVSWLHDESEGNADVQHTVTSYDPEDAGKAGEQFESELMSLGDIFTQQFDESGVYYYNCSLYPFMTGKVCVGDESEDLDEDCAIDLTNLESADTTTTTTTTTTTEETLPEEEIVPATTTTTTTTTTTPEEETATADLLTLLDETDENENLFEAADEEFTGKAQVNFESDSALSGNVMAADSVSDSDGKLSKSGPEDLIYLIPLLFAFVVARKLTAKA